MIAKLTTGFIVASLVQAGIIVFAENAGIIILEPKLTSLQLFYHILIGLVTGFILYYIILKVPTISNLKSYYVGTIYGIILWPINLGIGSMQGVVNSPLNFNIITVIWTLVAFIVYGLIVSYSIYYYGYEKVEAS